ncbi:hypothetical protein VCRA2110O174_750001 [Vibrio crassostreae]|nr:hypothetical protein VCRA2110O174_750001 [Vibrio crassostreae]
MLCFFMICWLLLLVELLVGLGHLLKSLFTLILVNAELGLRFLAKCVLNSVLLCGFRIYWILTFLL